MTIIIRTIPHAEQRYDTAGDWYWSEDKKTLNINVSRCNEDSEFLIGVHELIEAFLFTRKIGDVIKATQEVDRFDMDVNNVAFEEPGDNPEAPYHEQHMFATLMERLIAREMKYDWDEHEGSIELLEEGSDEDTGL